MFDFPPEDRELSPVTGYTRAHWLAAADGQLAAVRPYASPGRASIDLPGRPSFSGSRSDGLEGFARTFLLAALRVAGAPSGNSGAGATAPHERDILDFYRAGLIAGTTPGSSEAWPPIGNKAQPLVESASIALGLWLTRRTLWPELSEAEQDGVCAWLTGAAGVATPDNNWVLFKVVVQEFLAFTGRDFHAPDIDDGLARIEDWYIGHGWYRDGSGDNFDYYNGWALHLYPLMWTLMADERIPAEARRRRDIYRRRLREFLEDYVYFFGADGSPILQGRSLIYRFAATAPLWLGVLFDVSPVPLGTVRRMASGTLRHFVDHCAFGADGVLPLGWYGEFLPMTQSYSGPGSPYWASKGFLGLLLPEDHPVWATPEEPAPVERADAVRSLPGPGFVLSSTAADGVTRLANHGSDHVPTIEFGDDANYSRLSYSSHTAPAYGVDPLDNHVAILDESGRPSQRGKIHRVGAASGGGAASYHHPIWGDDDADTSWTLTTAVAMRGPYELRLHVVESAVERPATIREGGYAVGPDSALVSSLIPLHGYTETDRVRVDGASPFGDVAWVPTLTGTHHGKRSVFASLVVLSADSAARDVPSHVGPATCIDDGSRVAITLTLPDGDLSVALPAR